MSQHYAGLDVSLDAVHICVIDEAGAPVWRGQTSVSPDSIRDALNEHAPALVQAGLETGQFAPWLTLQLRKRKIPTVCLDARHVYAAIKLQRNKTDQGDAFCLAQIVRTGWYREVAVKSMDAHDLRSMLLARSQLVGQRQTIANLIRGLLKTHGHVVRRGCKGVFAVRVNAALQDSPTLGAIIEPLLNAWQALREQIAVLEKRLVARAREDVVARRLMTVPGIGPLVSLAFMSTVDDPTRFSSSADVGAYFGLTPKRWQSGEVDFQGKISRCGDAFMRGYLFEAAAVLMGRWCKPSALREWGERLAARSSLRKAKVALARKLAVLLHRLWITGKEFNAYPIGAVAG